MKYYVESKLCACGITFGIVVTDERDFPFRAGCMNLEQTDVLEGYFLFATHTEAIKYIANLAVQWLSQ